MSETLTSPGPSILPSTPSSNLSSPAPTASDGAAPVSPTTVEAPPSRPEPSGRKVILALFTLLAVGTAASLLFFASQVEEQYRPRIYVALVGDLMLPLIAWQLFRVIEARRQV